MRERLLDDTMLHAAERAARQLPAWGHSTAKAITLAADAGQHAGITQAFGRLSGADQRAVINDLAQVFSTHRGSDVTLSGRDAPLTRLANALHQTYTAVAQHGLARGGDAEWARHAALLPRESAAACANTPAGTQATDSRTASAWAADAAMPAIRPEAGRYGSPLGNALGQVIVDEMPSDRNVSNANYRNEMDLESDSANSGDPNGLDAQSDEWVAANGPGKVGHSVQVHKQLLAARERQWIAQDDAIMERRSADAGAAGIPRGPTNARARALGYVGDANPPAGAGSPGAYMSAYDPAADRERQASLQRTGTTIGLLIGGVTTGWATGARMAGASDSVVNDLAVAEFGVATPLAATLAGAGLISLTPARVPLGPGSGSLAGQAEVALRNANADQLRSIQRQNEATEFLSRQGFDVVRLPNAGSQGVKNPDAAINGQLADVYSPRTGNLWTIRDNIASKIEQQAPNFVLNLTDSPLSPTQVVNHLQANPMPVNNLVIVKDGKVAVVVR